LQHLHKESASSKRKMILGEKSKMQEEWRTKKESLHKYSLNNHNTL
jgi:hypothetical protein